MNDADSSPEYRPISRLAVLGLALGVASLVVLVGPPNTAAIPAAALIVCAAALSRIRSDPSLAGGGIALAGLLLAAFSLIAGSTYWLVRDRQLRRTAEQVAGSFVERLVDGDVRAAHQMTLAPKLRFSPDAPLAESYRDHAEARDRLSAFQRDPVVRKLRTLPGSRVVATDVAWHEANGNVNGFGVHVFVGGPSQETAAVVVRVLVERPPGSAPENWIVSKQLLDEPGDELH